MVDLLIYDTQQPSQPIAALAFSYTQAGQPSLLRLAYGPPQEAVDSAAFPSTNLDSWLHPSDDVKLTVTPLQDLTDDHSEMPEGLEAQILRLDLLQNHAADIQQEIKATEAKIMAIWKDEFAKCDSIKCYLKTAVAKAPGVAHLLAAHLSHHSRIDADFFRNSTHMNCTMEVEKVVEQHEKQMVLVDLGEDADSTGEDDAADEKLSADDAAEAGEEMDATTEEASDDSSQNEEPDSRGRRPTWRHSGRRRPWAKGGKPPFGRPPWAQGGKPHFGRPPWATEENHTPAASGPSDDERNRAYHFQPFSLTPQDRFRIAFFILAALVVGVSGLTLACCLCIRRKCMFLRDPRRKADCAARREERRTRALYRKAACKYRMRTFFQRFRRPFASSDYEEKRELILHSGDEESSSDVVRPQINSLRAIHDFLNGQLRRAEEGTAGVSTRRTQQQISAERDVADRASIRSETLPAYSLPPPSYRNGGLGSDISVVTGFTGYTPSGSGDTRDDTTESSIVDCTPRLSFDSQRTETTRSRE